VSIVWQLANYVLIYILHDNLTDTTAPLTGLDKRLIAGSCGFQALQVLVILAVSLKFVRKANDVSFWFLVQSYVSTVLLFGGLYATICLTATDHDGAFYLPTRFYAVRQILVNTTSLGAGAPSSAAVQAVQAVAASATVSAVATPGVAAATASTATAATAAADAMSAVVAGMGPATAAAGVAAAASGDVVGAVQSAAASAGRKLSELGGRHHVKESRVLLFWPMVLEFIYFSICVFSATGTTCPACYGWLGLEGHALNADLVAVAGYGDIFPRNWYSRLMVCAVR